MTLQQGLVGLTRWPSWLISEESHAFACVRRVMNVFPFPSTDSQVLLLLFSVVLDSSSARQSTASRGKSPTVTTFHWRAS